MEGGVIMNAQLIYSIACAAMQHDAVLKIHYNDGTKIAVRPRDYDAVKNPRCNNGNCVLHYNFESDKYPNRFVFHHNSICEIRIN